MADEFRAMQPITIGIQKSDDRLEFFPSLVLDYAPGQSLLVGVPTEQGNEVRLRGGQPVVVDVSQPTGIVRYRSVVRGRSESPLGVQLDWPGKGERIQRREHFRVQIQFPVEGQLRRGGERELFRGTTMDLSAGGLRLRLPHALPSGTHLDMRLQIPGMSSPLQCAGRVIRSGEIDGATSFERYWNGVEFRDLAESARKDITKYIFEVQRDQMRKGIL